MNAARPLRALRRVHVFDTNPWLRRQITSNQVSTHTLVDDPRDADTLIYPVPGWFEGQAPGLLRRISPRDWARLFVYSTDDRPMLWAPGIYASAPRSRAGDGPFRGGHYLVHHSIEDGGLKLEPWDHGSADRLWSFVGSAATCPKLRSRVLNLEDPLSIRQDTWEWHAKTRWEWREAAGETERPAFRDYSEALRRSSFVVCPRGVGPSSMRIFEAMEAARCPVIVSDEWLAPPFADWASCSLRIDECDVATLPERLRSEEHRAAELGSNARKEWERWFSAERILDFLVAAIDDIRIEGGADRRGRLEVVTRSLATKESLIRARLRLRRP